MDDNIPENPAAGFVRLFRKMRSEHLEVDGGLTESPHVDFFFELSKGNRTVETVSLILYPQGDFYTSWETVGKALGNLEALQEIKVTWREDLQRVHDWRALSDALRFLGHKIKVRVGEANYFWIKAEVLNFASAIRYSPSIKAIEHGGYIPAEYLNIFEVLGTLPYLEDVTLNGTLMLEHYNHLLPSKMKSIQVLLESSSLRSFTLDCCWITLEMVQCLALALNCSASTLTCLRLIMCCFPDGNTDLIYMASAMRTNTSLTHLELTDYDGITQDAFVREMEQVVRVNTTLTNLNLHGWAGHYGNAVPRIITAMPLIITALEENTTLKNFKIDLEQCDLFEAFGNSLKRNSTLECLTLFWHDGGVLAQLLETVSFLRVNASLMSLTLVCKEAPADEETDARGVGPLFVGPLCIETVSTLAENTSLENLDIDGKNDSKISPADYLTALEALGPNTTLKTLRLYPNLSSFGSDQAEKLLSLIRNNYGLECLDDGLPDPTGEVGCILRLNKAGRRYMLRDPSSISGRINVFAGISDDPDCVLFHIREIIAKSL
jgi:hypothetical protein